MKSASLAVFRPARSEPIVMATGSPQLCAGKVVVVEVLVVVVVVVVVVVLVVTTAEIRLAMASGLNRNVDAKLVWSTPGVTGNPGKKGPPVISTDRVQPVI